MKRKELNWGDSFEFLRRSMAMMSYTLLIVTTLAFTAFRVEKKLGHGSWGYNTLAGFCVAALLVAAVAISYDCFSRYKNAHPFNFFINLILWVFSVAFLVLILIYAVHNAASLYSAIYPLA